MSFNSGDKVLIPIPRSRTGKFGVWMRGTIQRKHRTFNDVYVVKLENSSRTFYRSTSEIKNDPNQESIFEEG